MPEPPALGGRDVARIPHNVDIVIVRSLRLIYVDNVKAGSTLIRTVIREHADASWDCSAHWRAIQGCCTEGKLRTTTACIGPEHSGFLTFSFVRNPIAKFESGVRQAWVEDPARFSGKDADAILHDVLSGLNGEHAFTNEHLQPSWYRPSGQNRLHQPVQLHFIGRLESMQRDWTALLRLWAPEFLARTLPAMGEHVNSRDHAIRSMLSAEAACALCKSVVYGHDVALFHYESECSGVAAGNCNCTERVG